MACERALQYEFAKALIDSGRRLEGRMLRIFERSHVMENCMVSMLRAVGFDLRARKADGERRVMVLRDSEQACRSARDTGQFAQGELRNLSRLLPIWQKPFLKS